MAFKKVLFFILIIVVVFAVSITIITLQGNITAKIRTDIQPLTNCFPNFISDDNTVSCCWITEQYPSNVRIGPNTYRIKGCIEITSSELNQLLNKYEFTECEITVNENFLSYISEYENIKWCYSPELSYEITKSNFVGHVYLDINNGIYYFELDSN